MAINESQILAPLLPETGEDPDRPYISADNLVQAMRLMLRGVDDAIISQVATELVHIKDELLHTAESNKASTAGIIASIELVKNQLNDLAANKLSVSGGTMTGPLLGAHGLLSATAPADVTGPFTVTASGDLVYQGHGAADGAVLVSDANGKAMWQPLAPTWQNNLAYKAGQMTLYNGELYIATADTTGVLPTDPTSSWRKVGFSLPPYTSPADEGKVATVVGTAIQWVDPSHWPALMRLAAYLPPVHDTTLLPATAAAGTICVVASEGLPYIFDGAQWQKQYRVGPTGPIGPQGATGPAGPQGLQGDVGPALTVEPGVSYNYARPPGESDADYKTHNEAAALAKLGLEYNATGQRGAPVPGIYVEAFNASGGDATLFAYVKGDPSDAIPGNQIDHWVVAGNIVGPVGATGPVGPRGAIGPVGITGPIGVTGVTGPQGVIGPVGGTGGTGAKGDKGDKGDTGDQGLTGPIGPTGPQGIQGIKGDKGDTGDQGVIGPSGVTGVTGATGPAGSVGGTGGTGATGGTGGTGAQGAKGDQGDQGIKGDKGDTGATGPIGPGSTVPGPQGPTGPIGHGLTPKGVVSDPQHLPAVNLAGDFWIDSTTRHGHVSPADNTPPAGWIDLGLMQGVKGDIGNTGPTGAQGVTGATGHVGGTGGVGPQGIKGVTGATGATGPTGLSGPIGKTGPAGPQGAASTVAGPAGPMGITGATGAKGNQGIAGPSGTPGAVGATGKTGPAGPAGGTGARGTQGVKGDQGVTGVTGAQGAPGGAGAPGTPGAKGVTGATGPTGPTGVGGIKGATGATGPAGTGINVKGHLAITGAIAPGAGGVPAAGSLTAGDAWTNASNTLYVWTGTAFVNMGNIQGPAGPAGAVGATGKTGPAGPAGSVGPKGVTGATGPASTVPGPAGGTGGTGAKGAAGAQGGTGAPGASGAKGVTGATGVSGVKGVTGVTGVSGVKGVTGVTGVTGPAVKVVTAAPTAVPAGAAQGTLIAVV